MGDGDMTTDDTEDLGSLVAEGFSVPEPPPGFGPGFLSDYWKSQDALPKISGMEVALYYLQRGFHSIVSLPMSSGITILTIGVALFSLGGFLLILQNVEEVIEGSGSNYQLTAYFRDSVGEADVLSFMEQLEQDTRIRSVKYISREQAIELFREELGPKQSLLDGIAAVNPLPASVDLVVQPDELGISSVENVVESLRASDLIDDLVYGSEWVEKTQGVLRVFRLFGISALLIALAIIVFLISNTIKLVIYARRDEVAIMQLVGASDSFIKIPFVLGGLLQGLVGSIFGLGFLRLGFLLLDMQIRNSTVLGVGIPEIHFLTLWGLIAILLVGAVVGAVGSFFALGRFMNV